MLQVQNTKFTKFQLTFHRAKQSCLSCNSKCSIWFRFIEHFIEQNKAAYLATPNARFGLGTHLFVKVPRPGHSEVTFSVFESVTTQTSKLHTKTAWRHYDCSTVHTIQKHSDFAIIWLSWAMRFMQFQWFAAHMMVTGSNPATNGRTVKQYLTSRLKGFVLNFCQKSPLWSLVEIPFFYKFAPLLLFAMFNRIANIMIIFLLLQ